MTRTVAKRLGGLAVLDGIVLMVLAVNLFPVSDASSKYLTRDYHVLQILWARNLGQLVVMAAILARQGGTLFRSRKIGLQALRGVLVLLSTIFMLGALAYLPLVEAIAISFAYPLFIVALSVPLLRERVGRYRWTAVLVGMAGVLVVMRPGLGVVHWAASLALLSALAGALFQIASRALSGIDDARTTLLYSAAIGFALLSPAMIFVWTDIDWIGAAWRVATALVYSLASYAMIRAFDFAPASTLAPLAYTQVLSAAAIGYFFFDDTPDYWTVLGLAIVTGAGLYVAHRERVRARGTPS